MTSLIVFKFVTKNRKNVLDQQRCKTLKKLPKAIQKFRSRFLLAIEDVEESDEE